MPTLSLPPETALTWLQSGPPDLPDGIRAGASIRYLAQLGMFAAELIESGRVLPTIDRDETGPIALWQPVFRGQDLPMMHALTASMPPVCRAMPEARDPHQLISEILSNLVDAGARSRLSGQAMLPPRRGRRPRKTPAVESWLEALNSADGRFTVHDDSELTALERALGPWTEVGAGQTGPAHATFRLTEVTVATNPQEPLSEDDVLSRDDFEVAPWSEEAPVSDEDPLVAREAAQQPVETSSEWQLEFLLQSTVDPSLLVPAGQVWNDEGALRRWLEQPQDLLLGELGRASRVFPELAEGLRQARPTSLSLSTEQVYHFLSETAAQLDDAGFGLLLPTWWDHRAKLGLKLSATTPTDPLAAESGAFGREQLCEFQWQLALGDSTLTEGEISALVEAKAPMVRLRGQWVTISPEQLRRGMDFLSREPASHKSVAEVLSLAAIPPEDPDLPLDITGVEADGWLGELLEGTAPQTLRPVEPPESFTAQLRPYQQRGLSWLAFLSSIGLGACLADDMGLGKTIQVLALESHQRAEDPDGGPTLLLCPMSLVGNWQREAARFAPQLCVYAHHGPQRRHAEALDDELGRADLVVTTYGTAMRDIEELAPVRWGRVVLDEAQAIKNSLSRSAKAARKLQASHRIALTGTPVENRLSELWSIMEFLNPGLLGSSELFRTRFAIPVERYGDAEKASTLRQMTRPYVLRRLKTDPEVIDDLPEKIEMKQYCRLTTEQASLYQVVVDDMMTKISDSSGIERHGNVLAAMTKLKQVCNHPAQLLHDRSSIGARSGKIIRLEEILEEILAAGDRVLCFTQFTEFAEMLLPHLAARFGTDVAYLHGKTPKARRDEMVEHFQSGKGPAIFLLSLKAGGTGLTLTAANHVIHLDRWWNPAVENQATDRAFRIGQSRNVKVHKFICSGTLEEKIDDMIEEKKALADLVISDGENWLTELSTNDLHSLLKLSEGAVGE